MIRMKGAWGGIAGVLLAAHGSVAWACDALEIEGGSPIKVNAEAAVIIWDEAHHTEHFIRRATFDSSGKSMGFLVPTPNVPTVTAATDEIFSSLDAAMQPRTRTHLTSGYRFDWALLPDRKEAAVPAVYYPTVPAPQQVKKSPLRMQKSTAIGGYTATVLAARDERQLERWLRRNKFKTDAGTRAWLKPYIDRGWSITAFKIRPGTDSTELSPVRLSFKTDKPYYPYREPVTARLKGKYAKDRTLKVYYIAKQRGDGGIGQTASWPGEVAWSAALPSIGRADLQKGAALAAAQIPGEARLTVFNDTASPRPGTDEVFFRPSPDQRKIMPEPIDRWSDGRTKIPLELFVLAIVGSCIGAMKMTNRAFGRRKSNRV